MKKLIAFYTLVLFLHLVLFPSKVFADLLIPEKDNCFWNEIPVTCSPFEDCSRSKYRIANTYTREHDNSITSQFDKACKIATLTELVQKYLEPLVLTFILTIILEILVYVIGGFRKSKDILYVLVVNSITLPVAYLLLKYIYSYLFILLSSRFGDFIGQYAPLFMLEICVVLFEIFFLVKLAKFKNEKRTKLIILIANIFSSTLGIYIYTMISNRLGKF